MKAYHPDGQIIEILNYTNDVKDGKWQQYFMNGLPKLEAVYSEGVLSGHARYFYINGVVSSEGEYVNNLKSGEWRVYNEKGNLVMIEIWENGIVKEKKALDN